MAAPFPESHQFARATMQVSPVGCGWCTRPILQGRLAADEAWATFSKAATSGRGPHYDLSESNPSSSLDAAEPFEMRVSNILCGCWRQADGLQNLNHRLPIS